MRSRMGRILLVVGFVILGSQAAHASTLPSGKPASFTQPSVYAIQHHNQTWWWKGRWYPNHHPKPVKSVPVPATLLPLGVGLAAFIVWRGLRRRGPK